MIASLPMYVRPETEAALARLWAGTRDLLGRDGIDAPNRLSHPVDLLEHWRDPDLVLSQTCGLPFRARLAGHVTLVGTPDCREPDVPAGHYTSVLVVRRDDPRRSLSDFDGAIPAVNDALSQSGWAALVSTAGAAGIELAAPYMSGAHRASARAVALGEADIAAIDSLTWSMILRWDAVAGDLRPLTRSAPTPGLPFITAAGRDPAPVRRAMSEALAGLAPADRNTLGWHGVVEIPEGAYLEIPIPPDP